MLRKIVFQRSTRYFSSNSNIRDLFSQSEAHRKIKNTIEEKRQEELALDVYKLEDVDSRAIEDLGDILKKNNSNQVDKILGDYSFLLKSIRAKRRLTIDWTNIRDDDMSAVKRVAKRVGVTWDGNKNEPQA